MTTGAANDIQRATALARNMVALYGMSEELGLMAPASITNQYLEGQAQLDCSQATAATIDATVQKLLNACYEDATRILTENRALLDEIAEYLLVKESISGEELMAFVDPEKKAEVLDQQTAESSEEPIRETPEQEEPTEVEANEEAETE
jgi:cell division protease FtsH